MSYRPTASAADIEWVDCHGDTQVFGYLVTTSDLEALEEPGDRRPDGKLTREALGRIAAILSTHLQLLHAQTLAAHGADPDSVVYRDCDGLLRAETNRLGWPESKPSRHWSRHCRHVQPTKPHLCPTKPE